MSEQAASEATNGPSVPGRAETRDDARDDTNVQPFLDRYARALVAGDAATVGSMWEIPALVVADQSVRAIGAAAEVEAFFGGAAAQYIARGITGTRADIVWFDQATDRVVIAQVRWPHLDKDGKELGEEVSTYTLRRGDSGDFKIRAVVMHGAAGIH
jgi:hypothetical protein